MERVALYYVSKIIGTDYTEVIAVHSVIKGS